LLSKTLGMVSAATCFLAAVGAAKPGTATGRTATRARGTRRRLQRAPKTQPLQCIGEVLGLLSSFAGLGAAITAIDDQTTFTEGMEIPYEMTCMLLDVGGTIGAFDGPLAPQLFIMLSMNPVAAVLLPTTVIPP
jgi:hypothetical protein